MGWLKERKMKRTRNVSERRDVGCIVGALIFAVRYDICNTFCSGGDILGEIIIGRDEMIKKLLFVAVLISLCTGCGLRNMGNPQALISRDTIVLEDNSFVRIENDTRVVLVDIAKEFELDAKRVDDNGWVFKNKDRIVAVMDYFGVSEKRATVVARDKYTSWRSLEMFVPETNVIDDSREYSIWLFRVGGPGLITYEYVERKPVAGGWINYQIRYREKIPSEFDKKVWNNSWDFGGTYMDDSIKRAQSSFTIHSF